MPTTFATIENLEDGRPWTPDRYHRVSPKQINYETRGWRVLKDRGVQVSGEKDVRRTAGEPATMKRLRPIFAPYLRDFSQAELALAILANESKGNLQAERYEERIKDYSFGPAQFLTATAYGLLRENGFVAPAYPVNNGGSVEVWKRYLCNAENSVELLRIYITRLNARFQLKGDPILIYASYNAGSPRPSASVNDWGLVTNRPETLDKIAAWLGDAYATRPVALT